VDALAVLDPVGSGHAGEDGVAEAVTQGTHGSRR
jgi:hypothetical protein